MVKYRSGARVLQDAALLNRSLSAVVGRAGLSRAPLGARSASGPAVSAVLSQRSAVPRWNVVSASRVLNETEVVGFLRELRADPDVEYAEVEHMYQHMAVDSRAVTPNDPLYAARQWNFFNPTSGVNAPAAWDIAQGDGVVVAVLDTGIVQDHLDLQANVMPGYDMISDLRISRRATDARVPGGWDVGDWVEPNYCDGWAGVAAPRNSSWHGSHVAGTIAQETGNGVGLAGLAYKAKVMPVRVLGSCGGTEADIADGIVWAVGGEVPGLPLNPNPAEVINMSLGSGSHNACSPLLQAAMDLANSKGAIIVVAAGNSDDKAASYTMSSCKNIISVGANGLNGDRAFYSSYGARVDVSAPGGNGGLLNSGFIWQVINGGATRPTARWVTGGKAGTSMASPHVAAAVAMIQGVAATPLNWLQMRNLLRETARPAPVLASGSKQNGAGLLDIHAALLKALVPPCDASQQTCPLAATPLFSKIVDELDGDRGSSQLFRFEAKAGEVLSFITYGGRGDVSLYASFNKEPQAGQADAFSTRPGNSETVRFIAPSAGTYYVKLVGVSAFTDVSLVARQ